MRQALTIAKPGQGVQLDVKYVYPQGRRQYQFSALDHYSKKYHFSIFDAKDSNHAILALRASGEIFWIYRLLGVDGQRVGIQG